MKTKCYKNQLYKVLNAAKEEESQICLGGESKWDYEQIHSVVIPEMEELLMHMENGEVFFKYGKQQRLLESSYLITDSLDCLCETKLGKEILGLQTIYNHL